MKKDSKAKNGSIYKKIVSVLLVTVSVLLLTKLVVVNFLATSGVRLAAATMRIKELKEENQKLENQVSKINSLVNIENYAKQAGFIKAENVQVLQSGGSLANR